MDWLSLTHGDSPMTHLKSLTFTVVPKGTSTDPKLVRRHRLVERLEQQRQLAGNPSLTVLVRRFTKDSEGVKQIVDRPKRVKPWWKADGSGNLVLVMRSGLKAIELEKGKAGILVGAPDRLDGVLVTLIAAVKAGELDGALEAAKGGGQPKSKKGV